MIADTEMFCFYADSIASFRLVAAIWITFNLNCNLSSIKSNDFHNLISLFFCSWNAFFKRVSIETFWLHQRNIIETRSIRCLDDYWRRTSREDMISSFYRPQIVIIKHDTQCELTEDIDLICIRVIYINKIWNSRV